MTQVSGAVLVMDAVPRPDPDDLAAVLGPRRRTELETELVARATEWGRGLAPDDCHLATGGESLSGAVTRAVGAQTRDLLIVWPYLVRLRRAHADAALGDLDAGADVVLGPVIDGGLYLLGLSRPVPELLGRLDEALAGGDLGTLGISVASDLGLELGLLRVERGLRTGADVAAALADPVTPPEVRRFLAPEDYEGERPDLPGPAG